jgi:hypothetical protein
MLVSGTYCLIWAILPPFYFREHLVVAWLAARTHGENLHRYRNEAMNNTKDEDCLATRLSEINLSHPASQSSTQGRCSSVAVQRQDSVLEHQAHPASSNGKILADDPDLKIQSIDGKWRLTIDDYDDPGICSFQVDVVFYNSRKAIGLLHSVDNESLQIAVSGYDSVQEMAYQRSNSKTTDRALAIMNHLGVGFRLSSWASHVEPQLLTRIWSDPAAKSRTYTIFINKKICVSCKAVLEQVHRGRTISPLGHDRIDTAKIACAKNQTASQDLHRVYWSFIAFHLFIVGRRSGGFVRSNGTMLF